MERLWGPWVRRHVRFHGRFGRPPRPPFWPRLGIGRVKSICFNGIDLWGGLWGGLKMGLSPLD